MFLPIAPSICSTMMSRLTLPFMSRVGFAVVVDSILLVSSDSDYWSLISSLDTANFLVMVESEKCGPDLKEALKKTGIFYCYLDDFYAGGGEELKNNVITAEVSRQLQNYAFNLEDLLREALYVTRASMSPTEQERFMEKNLRRMEINIDSENNVTIQLKR